MSEPADTGVFMTRSWAPSWARGPVMTMTMIMGGWSALSELLELNETYRFWTDVT